MLIAHILKLLFLFFIVSSITALILLLLGAIGATLFICFLVLAPIIFFFFMGWNLCGLFLLPLIFFLPIFFFAALAFFVFKGVCKLFAPIKNKFSNNNSQIN